MANSLSTPQIDALRLALPALLGDLDETTFETIRPHLSWEWVELVGGQVLFREGDPSDALYVLVSGRLQATVTTSGGQQQLVGEVGRGSKIIFLLMLVCIGVWIRSGFSIHQYVTFFFFCALWGYILFQMAESAQNEDAMQSLVENPDLFIRALSERKIMIVRRQGEATSSI